MLNAEEVKAMKRARAHLAKGWIQGELKDGSGSVCLVGACREASLTARGMYESPLRHRLVAELADELGAPLFARGSKFIASWNDIPGRKKSEVLSLMDRVIARNEGELARVTVAEADLSVSGD